MKNIKPAITFKVVVGYLLITALAVFAVRYIYGQIVNVSENARLNSLNNQKLFLISEAATNLYTVEGIGREVIQNQNTKELPRLKAQIDTISVIIDSLKTLSDNINIKQELDSVNYYLDQKAKNIQELLDLRRRGATDSYYSKVISRLQKIDDSFEDQNYEEQLQDLEPTVRNAIIGFINFSKENRAEELTHKTADSLVNSLKTVLSDLESQERRIMLTINQKENELLENDRIISGQLHKLRADIEQDEIQKSVEQVAESQRLLQQTSVIIGAAGIVSVLTILLFVFLIMKDTNRSHKYRQELEASKNFTETLLKSREQIMAAVTHDMRSPLNMVVGYSDLLEKTNLSEKQRHYLSHLKTSSDYILRLVNDLLDLSKLEAGKIMIEKFRFSLRNIIDEAIKNTVPQEDPKNLEIEINIEETLEKEIVSDPFRLQQILTNLLSNAYKFTEKGKISIKAELRRINKNPNTLKIKVTDTGIGISKKNLQRVFEEFSQADSSIEKQYGGYGLGLSITKKLVSLLQGEIHLDSEEGIGSTFTFYFPIEFANADAEKETNDVQEIDAGLLENKRVLIVDDEPLQLSLTSEVVQNAGLYFETGNNVKDALEKLQNSDFHLVLTDIQMPGEDGFSLLEHIKLHPETADIPVVALSGRTDVTADTYLEKGFSGSLLKPYKADDLLHLISRCLNIENLQKPTQKDHEPKRTSSGLYDLEDISLFTQDDTASLNAILKTFIENTLLNLREIEDFAKQGDSEKMAFTAHRMLPMFRQLKIQTCIPLLEQLEENRPESEMPNDEIAVLKKEILKVVDALEKQIKD